MLQRLAFLFVVILVSIPVSIAYAHSPIEKRNPNVNAVLESAPAIVDLYFKDPVQIHRSSVIVRDEKNKEVQIGKPQIDPNNNRHILVKVLLFLIIILFGIRQRRLLVKVTEKLVAVFYKNIKIELGIAIIILFIMGILVDLSPEEALQGNFTTGSNDFGGYCRSRRIPAKTRWQRHNDTT